MFIETKQVKVNIRATWDGEIGRWRHQINIKVCVQAFAEEIRLTTCVILLEYVLSALFYLNLRSFSTSATACLPSLPTLNCDIPEILSICHLRRLVVSSMVHLSAGQNCIITNDNFLNLESMNFKKKRNWKLYFSICERVLWGSFTKLWNLPKY